MEILTSLLDAAAAGSTVCPEAGTSELVEYEAVRAGAEDGDTASAFVVFGTVGGFLMLEVAVHAGALNAVGLSWLWRTEGKERDEKGKQR